MPVLALSPGREVLFTKLMKKMEIIFQHLKEYIPNFSVISKFRNTTKHYNFPQRIQ